MRHSDQKYIEALVTNDRILLEEIYRKFAGKIKGMVLKNNGTETDAADIFQEALVSIYRKARDQNFELLCPFEAFLYLICKNLWLKELSKRKLLPVQFDEDGMDLGDDSVKLAEECMVQEQRMQLLHEKVAELGDSCQQLLRLSWEGKSMEEVAQILGMTYGYARKKKAGCMEKLITLVKQAPQFSFLKW
ncbi:RNA polymerase sigma factor [Adhaeribacter radiodurans]|uniref:Sigma-70 family RNA polymerase sigma factor n=1 Tax=Adhaeribacter radiodurans TaxID=2745197 RepID=A0A7L7LCP1_9BACT|nr:sigma-70 family RNA polymerase sigma factor [Adhaeribacter radiodurans]QMU30543.1 sigma-70 family RNA polymerase sigma factor [Adhaeribacter radiodurans]